MCLKVVPTMGKEKKSGQKQSKQKPSPSQGVGMVTPRDGNNVPKRASSPTSGHTSALEESIVKYKKRVTKLEIENEDLRIDVRTLHTDKSLILHSFAKLQAQCGQVIGRLEIFEQFHKEKQEVSGGKSGDTTANMTKFEPIELPRDLSDK